MAAEYHPRGGGRHHRARTLPDRRRPRGPAATGMTSAPILDVRDLRVELPLSRGTVHAVDGASLSVASGEAFGLVGESGCGKSMTLRAIMGLLPRPGRIVGGEVLFEGEDLVTAPAGRLREIRGGSIAMIFQEPMTALNPVMRVGDQIA